MKTKKKKRLYNIWKVKLHSLFFNFFFVCKFFQLLFMWFFFFLISFFFKVDTLLYFNQVFFESLEVQFYSAKISESYTVLEAEINILLNKFYLNKLSTIMIRKYFFFLMYTKNVLYNINIHVKWNIVSGTIVIHKRNRL